MMVRARVSATAAIATAKAASMATPKAVAARAVAVRATAPRAFTATAAAACAIAYLVPRIGDEPVVDALLDAESDDFDGMAAQHGVAVLGCRVCRARVGECEANVSKE